MSRLLLLSMICIATGMFMPQSGLASCGDWLASHEDHEQNQVPAAEKSERPAPPQAPCQHCEKAPQAPTPATPDKVQRDHRELACLISIFKPTAVEPHRVQTPCEAVLIDGFPSRIERPPQA